MSDVMIRSMTARITTTAAGQESPTISAGAI